MSASLVGSEMCIRDSGFLQLGDRETGTPRGLLMSLSLDRSRSATATTPVSYTHLTLPTICSV
eukprot:12135404-Alexandrium_andersonii.AAC.1